MNIPNLNFEISLIQGFWNSSSKIDWFRSLAIEGQTSIVMTIVLLFITIIIYEKDFKKFNLWQCVGLVSLGIPFAVVYSYYIIKVWFFITFNSGFNIWLGMVLGFLGILVLCIPGGIVFYFVDRMEKIRKKSRKAR